jgi:hypothetical protein
VNLKKGRREEGGGRRVEGGGRREEGGGRREDFANENKNSSNEVVLIVKVLIVELALILVKNHQ